jgi:endonuclease G
MESFKIETINRYSGAEFILEAFRNTDLSDRKGYDPKFLGIEVKLPRITDEKITKSIAENNQPGPNGKHYLDYTNFSVLFNKDKKLPFFTVVNIVGKSNEIAKVHDARGSDSWFPDKRIEKDNETFQFTNDDYKASGFQKGHMVRFYDPAWGKTEAERKIAMGDTFHYTNCCPQLGKYNAGIWNDLEDYYLSRAIFQDDRVTVFTGPIFNKAKKIGELLVPVNFWKIIVYRVKNKLEAMAFLISHEVAYDKLVRENFLLEKKVQPSLKQTDIDRLFSGKNLKRWIVKVELIEEKTGLKFHLNDVDLNKNKFQYYNVSATALEKESNRMRYLMEYELFKANLDTPDDTEFIKNI